ncbi:MAG: hypothetical protein GF388_09735 [Candidatus Aegiribacteria sp.]|nr:hypothetical protein [Candidatus Aegiribacteria sp.]MBD3295319.1 hypothetical protein [Candidatus Fermentibacteria bacterium]
MHEKVLSKNCLELLKSIESDTPSLLQGWVLAGGTGLALQLGHRISDALDLFREDVEDVRHLHDELHPYEPYETLQDSAHTLTILMNGTKISFFRSEAPWLYETVPYRSFAIADMRDIAMMKLIAIHNRGSRKDFIDLYMILKGDLLLQDYFTLLPEKYDSSRINLYSILKSLNYFQDAEIEPMPTMLVPFRWEECKAYFIRAAHGIVLL